METTETINVELTLAFADATSRKLTFRGVEQSALSGIRNKVNALNYNNGQGMPDNVAKTFVSAIGAKLQIISKAQIVRIEEEVIYQ